MAVMADKIDVAELAREIAKIASTTCDPETGRRLMEIVEISDEGGRAAAGNRLSFETDTRQQRRRDQPGPSRLRSR